MIKEVDNIKQVPIRLDEELLKQLKIITIQNDTSIQRIVEEFLMAYVEQNQGSKKQ
jgi:predicted transcriptional regulator